MGADSEPITGTNSRYDSTGGVVSAWAVLREMFAHYTNAKGTNGLGSAATAEQVG
jgi:hypothetical protein